MTDGDDAEPAEFGADIDAAFKHCGGYGGFSEGAEFTHRVIDLLEQYLGELTLAWVPPATSRIGFRFARLRPMALTANWGYLWVTNPAVELMRGTESTRLEYSVMPDVDRRNVERRPRPVELQQGP